MEDSIPSHEQKYQIIRGDVASVEIPGLFHAVLCDPPYELGFMGKAWDSSGIAFQASLWRKILDACLPGAHLLAFGGTRTSHRMVCAIEDAGFEVRDSMSWIYGSGFPKSLDVSKAMDKAAGAEREAWEVPRNGGPAGKSDHIGQISANRKSGVGIASAPATDSAKQWNGYGTALKPAHEPICVARKPIEGTVAQNCLTHGTGAINVDGCRVGSREGEPQYRPASASGVGNGNACYGTRDGQEACYTAGRWPANVLLGHSADCSGETCVDGCPVQVLNEQSGELASGGTPFRRPSGMGYHGAAGQDAVNGNGGDTGGASRFFKTFDPEAPFFYCAKAPTAERGAGCGSLDASHPTVKPLKLTQYLATLILPPPLGVPRRILVPFSGSGSEMIGALLAGWDEVVGIEIGEEYAEIAHHRIAHHLGMDTPTRAIIEAAGPTTAAAMLPKEQQLSLFG